jgi:hypothetical protein
MYRIDYDLIQNHKTMFNKPFVLFIFVLLSISKVVLSQKPEYLEIKGEVVNLSLNPIQYVNVISLITSKGTFTDDDGKFSISVLKTDTILFTSISFKPKKMAVSQFTSENNYIILDSMVYSIQKIDVMDMRWHDLKQKVMEMKLTPLDQKILVIDGLPNPYMELIQIKPNLFMNPVSTIYEFLKKENIRKRKQARWNKTYDKTWIKSN